MKTQISKQHANEAAVQPQTTFHKEDRMKKQGSASGERVTMSKRSIAISVAFFLLAIASIPAHAWVADRISLTNYWVITCKDGYQHAGNYGPDGPDFYTGNMVCAMHGGLSVPPQPVLPGTRSLYGLSIPVDLSFASPVTVEDLFSQGVISSEDGFRLTNTFDQEVWASTFLEFSRVPIGGNTFKGVFVIGVATLTQAGTLFSDLGTGSNVYQSSNGLPVSGTGSPGGTSYTQANQFTAAVSGSISEIDVALGYVSGTNSFFVALYTASDGAPGTLVGQWDNLTSSQNFGGCCGLVSITGISGVNLVAGTSYFLVIGPTNLDSTTFEMWNLNSVGAVGLDLYATSGCQNGTGNGCSWNSNGVQTIGAFDILGSSGRSPARPMVKK